MKLHAASHSAVRLRADFVPLEQAQPALRACWEVAKGWDGVVEGDEDAKPNWAHTAGYLEVGSVYNCKLPPSSWFQRIGISQPSHLLPADSHIRVIRADDQLLSPTTAAQRSEGASGDTVAIAFGLNRALWGTDGAELFAKAAEMEAALEPFGAQPHWVRPSLTAPPLSALRLKAFCCGGVHRGS